MNKSFLIAVGGVVLILLLPVSIFFSQQQQKIEQRAAGTTIVGQYEKFELTYPYSGNYSNPNDPIIVDVEAVFTAPSGNMQTVPGFYFQDYTRSGNIQQQILTPDGSPVWKVRYAPQELGDYTYTVTLKDTTGIKTLGSGSFTVVSSNNPGFIRASGLHLLRDNGQPFFMLGVNAPGWQRYQTWQGHPWKWGDGTYGVDNLYQQMSANGLNWYHMWTCQAWAKPNIGCPKAGGDPKQMSQPDSWEIDYAIDQAHVYDIYTTIVLHFGTETFDPYDLIKARYFIARWGYSTNIVAWDYQKEISTDPTATAAWSSYVKSVDPYNHLRTTTQWNHYAILGLGHLNTFNAVFNDPNITMIQSHDYFSDCHDALTSDSSLYYFSIYADSDPRSSRRFNKPNFNGEGGLGNRTNCQNEGGGGGESPLVLTDHAGVILKGYAWGTFMSTLAGTSPWWYYTDPQAGWTQFTGFKALRAYADSLPIVPDSATTFTSYNDTSQAITSTPFLRVIGRKNANFAMAYIQNTTGTWSAIVRDNKIPMPTGGTITLKNMTGTFTVKWFDVDGETGNILKTETVTASGGNLALNLPTQITQSIAVLVTTGSSVTPTP